jgi:hypothetical protein
MPRLACLIPCALLLSTIAASAQTPAEPQTRAESLKAQREEKQTRLEPYEQNRFEWTMHLAEERIVPLLRRDGVYARLGSLSTSSGFAYGGGYRDRSLVKGRGFMDVWAAGSLKQYWAIDARAGYPLLPRDRLMVSGHFRTYSYPEEEFFGIGPDSQRANQVAYDLDGVTVGGQIAAQPIKPLTFGGGYEHLQATVSPARSGRLPPIDDIFEPGVTIPPLREHEYGRVSGFASFDYRQPLNARKGGWYRLEVSRYTDLRDQSETFTRTDLDLRQFIGFFAERRVIAARVRISTTDAARPELIPIFLLPSLGGNDTLRGFRALRFRGRHSMLLQGEYRWEIWSGLEAALFYDTGKVAQELRDLNFDALESDYGFGFRLNTDNGIIARVDAAFGSKDGKHLHIVFGGIF